MSMNVEKRMAQSNEESGLIQGGVGGSLIGSTKPTRMDALLKASVTVRDRINAAVDRLSVKLGALRGTQPSNTAGDEKRAEISGVLGKVEDVQSETFSAIDALDSLLDELDTIA